jgi:hypothetical protein
MVETHSPKHKMGGEMEAGCGALKEKTGQLEGLELLKTGTYK